MSSQETLDLHLVVVVFNIFGSIRNQFDGRLGRVVPDRSHHVLPSRRRCWYWGRGECKSSSIPYPFGSIYLDCVFVMDRRIQSQALMNTSVVYQIDDNINNIYRSTYFQDRRREQTMKRESRTASDQMRSKRARCLHRLRVRTWRQKRASACLFSEKKKRLCKHPVDDDDRRFPSCKIPKLTEKPASDRSLDGKLAPVP